MERRGAADAPWLRWFAVDCEPLSRRRIWLVTGALGDNAPEAGATEGFGVHVVLPTPAAQRLVDAGEGSVLAPMGVEHHLVSLGLDGPRPFDGARLETMLLLGYEASFA